MARLTKRVVDAAQGGSRDTFVWDDGLRGFGLKVTPVGRKVYVVQYRTGGREARSRRYTIGTHGSPWTPDKARTEAERLLTLASQGVDPMLVEKRRRADAVSLEVEVYAALFVERYLKTNWKASWDDGKRILDLHVVPHWKGHALSDITRRDVSTLIDRLADRPATARLMFATLRKLFRWAVERGDLALSPLSEMSGPQAVAARDRVLTDLELAAAWTAAGSLSYPYGPMFQLLIATGARRDEVAGLDWSEIDLATATWTLPAARAKNGSQHIIPLNAPAKELLEGLRPRRHGLIFSASGKAVPSGFSRAKRQLDVAMAGVLRQEALSGAENRAKAATPIPFRVHDLRRTVATGLQKLGVRFEVTEAVLNHLSGARSGVAGIYQRHDWADEKRAALQSWGCHVMLLAGRDSISGTA